jgi:hypothetical protein
MAIQAFSYPARVRARHVLAAFAFLGRHINEGSNEIFANVAAAFEASQRRKAIQLIRQYRHLIDEVDYLALLADMSVAAQARIMGVSKTAGGRQIPFEDSQTSPRHGGFERKEMENHD